MFRRAIVLLVLSVLFFGAGLIFVSPAEAAVCYEVEGGDYVCDARPGAAPFATPTPAADSFLDEVTYVRLDDFANVYDRPGGRIVRNVGDGFLYATVFGIEEVNGQLWYQINYGEYVPGSSLTLTEISQFAGVEVNVQPERPFGWIVLKVTPSNEPDGKPNKAYTELPRYSFVEVYDAVEGENGWLWYEIGDERWIRQTHVSLVNLTEPPAEVGAGEYWTQIDLFEQTFAAYQGKRMVFASLISSGLNQWPTHEGIFQVWDRFTVTKMSGAEGEVDYYFIEDVPHTMFFDYDIALHGAYWHDRFGYKHSHGCVNMPPLAAEWVFNWSENAPTDLWVNVYTSDPGDYFLNYGPSTD